MKHVIYEAILSAARGPGGVLCAPPAGSGAEPQRKSNLMHFSPKNRHLVASIFHFLWLSKKYFPLTFPWPLKFPDFFRFFLTYRNPGIVTVLTLKSRWINLFLSAGWFIIHNSVVLEPWSCSKDWSTRNVAILASISSSLVYVLTCSVSFAGLSFLLR